MARKAPAKTKAVLPPAGPVPEVVRVHTHRLSCEGVGGALGHPRVYLEMGSAGFVECPYCDRRFELHTGKADHVPGVSEDTGTH